MNAGQPVIFNADDFGRSASINAAVIQAHREGVLTTASLMVNGAAFAQAVELARENPSLGVGLHLTLVMGRATLPADQLPGLVNREGWFTNNPIAGGMSAFFNTGQRALLKREIAAQIEKFRQTGLTMDHVNGHLNFHLHPTVFDLLMELRAEWAGAGFRATKDIFWLNARLAKGRWMDRYFHAVIFNRLSARSRKRLRTDAIAHTEHVFGLLQNGRMDEPYLQQLLPALPPGPVEIYSHPSLHSHRHELDALTSPRIADLVKKLGIQPCRYQNLPPCSNT